MLSVRGHGVGLHFHIWCTGPARDCSKEHMLLKETRDTVPSDVVTKSPDCLLYCVWRQEVQQPL